VEDDRGSHLFRDTTAAFNFAAAALTADSNIVQAEANKEAGGDAASTYVR
jgi:hypothetical protein